MNEKETHRDLIDVGNSFLMPRREFVKRLGIIASTPLLGTFLAGCITQEASKIPNATPKPEYEVGTEMFQDTEGKSLQLLFNTTRIDVFSKNDFLGSGTGFFFQFPLTDKQAIPIVITNKHVVSDAERGKFYLNAMDDKGKPVIGQPLTVEMDNFKNQWLYHPEDSVDLCVMPVAPIFNLIAQSGKRVFYKAFAPDSIPNISKLEELTTIEEVIMIGYPVGLRDEKHNMPIIRKGITATHPALNYNDRPEFVIDVAAFPGSSGSPVLIYDQGTFQPTKNKIEARMYLLGILYGGPQYTVEGKIVVKNIPIRQEPISQTTIPINLGYVIKSQKILDFEGKLKELVNTKAQS